MDKLTFEEYCLYRDKEIKIIAMTKPIIENKGFKVIACDSDKEYSQLNEHLIIFSLSYEAIMDYPKQKDEILSAIAKYERSGNPFVIYHNYWESPDEPPEDFNFVGIDWGV